MTWGVLLCCLVQLAASLFVHVRLRNRRPTLSPYAAGLAALGEVQSQTRRSP